MRITAVTIVDKDEAPMFTDRIRTMVFTGFIPTTDVLWRIADVLTQESIGSHEEDYVADAENGPCADDIPLVWDVQMVLAAFHVSITETSLEKDKRIRPDERSTDGECAVCSRRHVHKNDCATLARRAAD